MPANSTVVATLGCRGTGEVTLDDILWGACRALKADFEMALSAAEAGCSGSPRQRLTPDAVRELSLGRNLSHTPIVPAVRRVQPISTSWSGQAALCGR